IVKFDGANAVNFAGGADGAHFGLTRCDPVAETDIDRGHGLLLNEEINIKHCHGKTKLAVANLAGRIEHPQAVSELKVLQPNLTLDPVCGMKVNPAGARGGAVEHAGQTYYFCSPSCAQKFQANPQQYLDRPASAVVNAPVSTSSSSA